MVIHAFPAQKPQRRPPCWHELEKVGILFWAAGSLASCLRIKDMGVFTETGTERACPQGLAWVLSKVCINSDILRKLGLAHHAAD